VAWFSGIADHVSMRGTRWEYLPEAVFLRWVVLSIELAVLPREEGVQYPDALRESPPYPRASVRRRRDL